MFRKLRKFINKLRKNTNMAEENMVPVSELLNSEENVQESTEKPVEGAGETVKETVNMFSGENPAIHNDRVLEVYGSKGDLVKTFTIKDGEDYIAKGKKFAVDGNYTIGILIR